eukprot:1688900-Rhodomonas_salina.1
MPFLVQTVRGSRSFAFDSAAPEADGELSDAGFWSQLRAKTRGCGGFNHVTCDVTATLFSLREETGSQWPSSLVCIRPWSNFASVF